MLARVIEIQNRLQLIESEFSQLRNELTQIQQECSHPNLPKRELGEKYLDYCPDCGYYSYCYVRS